MADKKVSKFVGGLILIAYAVLASEVLESSVAVMLLEVMSGVSVLGIAVLMFPYFKSYNKNISFGYLTLKVFEGTLMIIGGVIFLIGSASLLEARELMYMWHAYIFIFSAFLFYYLLHQSKLIPRFLSAWGIVAVVLLLVANLLEATGLKLPVWGLVLGYSQIVLNEIFLAVWLIVKGFKVSVPEVDSNIPK
jgi:hypothetical protein